jgi:flagellar protein FliS
MKMNAAAAYQDSKIKTATPAELTVMLYEGAIKFCNIAIIAMEKNDVPKTHLNIIKAENIVAELRNTLDPKYPISKEFDFMYDYIYRTLIDANLKKDKEILGEALGFIRELRDTWKDAMKMV